MSKLPLAVDIAEADAARSDPDLNEKAGQLQSKHPEANASREEIVQALDATSEKITRFRSRKP
jgi:hypothetical protein